MLDKYKYVPTDWKDDVLELDENGKPIPERDEAGNIIFETDSSGAIVIDPVTAKPIPKYRRVQKGTKFKAKYQNNQEQGILMAHERLDKQQDINTQVDVRLSILEKTPDNNGLFFDYYTEPPYNMMRLDTTTDIISAVNAGETELSVADTAGFSPHTQITIYDGKHKEEIMITSITESVITLQKPLQNSYEKGARVVRSSTQIVEGQLVNGSWGTYEITDVEVV